MPESGKRVGAHQAIECALRRQLRAQQEQRLQRVVRLAQRPRRIGQRDSEARFIGNGEARQFNPVFKAGRRSIHLERLRAHRSKKHSIKSESLAGGARQAIVEGRLAAYLESNLGRGSMWAATRR